MATKDDNHDVVAICSDSEEEDDTESEPSKGKLYFQGSVFAQYVFYKL